MELDASKIFHAILDQSARSEGATIALAKHLLKEDEFEVFLIEKDIQTLHSWSDILERFPDVTTEIDSVKTSIKEKISDLKSERDSKKK